MLRKRIFGDTILLRSTLNLFFLVLASLVKTVAFPLLVAVLIARLSSEARRSLFKSLFVFPIVVPGMVTVLLWKDYIYDPEIGMLNHALGALGLRSLEQAWLGEHATALLSYLLVGFPWVAGTGFLIFYAGLMAVPESVIESAVLDGVGPYRRFFQIELPLLLGQLRLVLVLTFIGTIQDFGGILLMTGGGPGAATHVPALHMYYMAFRFEQFGYAAAIGVALFLLILALSLINLRILRSNVED